MGACVLMNVCWHVCTAHPVHDSLAGQLIRPEQDMIKPSNPETLNPKPCSCFQFLPGCSSKQIEQVCRACRKRSMRREALYCSRRRTTCSVLSLLPRPPQIRTQQAGAWI